MRLIRIVTRDIRLGFLDSHVIRMEQGRAPNASVDIPGFF